MYVTCVTYDPGVNLLQKSFQEVMTRAHGGVAKKNELWKKEDMQRGNSVGAHRTVQDKRASLKQVAGDPEPVEGD